MFHSTSNDLSNLLKSDNVYRYAAFALSYKVPSWNAASCIPITHFLKYNFTAFSKMKGVVAVELEIYKFLCCT